MQNTRVLIAAAGKGSRSRLNYPKTLYKIDNTPILIKILKTFSEFDNIPTIIVSPSGEEIIDKTIKKYGFSADLIIQKKPTGMGDAILCYQKSEAYNKTDNILLIWGDVPFIKKKTLRILTKSHLKNKNHFTFLSGFSKKAYTVVKRNKNNEDIELEEYKYSNSKLSEGERDTGVFIFNKKIIFNELKLNRVDNFSNEINENGFLYIIKKLVKKKYKVEALKIANDKEMISFNQKSDLKKKVKV